MQPANRVLRMVGLLTFLPLTSAANPSPRTENQLLAPKAVFFGQSVAHEKMKEVSRSARTYYTFWNTGDPRYAKAALAPDFVDLNLPEGRPQGPEGPLIASKQFREAIPDLSVSVEEMYVVGDRAIGRLRFTGHFTGKFNGIAGKGQTIDFSAVDIYEIKGGKIISNWHLEDNLTLLKQMEVSER